VVGRNIYKPLLSLKTMVIRKEMKIGILFLALLVFSIGLGSASCPGGMSGSGTEGSPCQITNLQQLNATRDDLTLHYKLMNNIDASPTSGWNSGAGWEPIGYWIDSEDYLAFSGTFDGAGFVIGNLYINSSNSAGLFGHLSGEIKNIGLVDVNVSGSNFVGGLVGLHGSGASGEGLISNSYSTGTVSGYFYVGGLVGGRTGTINNSYSKANVSGTEYVGGLVGFGTPYYGIFNSYSTGTVSGHSTHVGGLIGIQISGGLVSNSFWDINSSGQTTSAGGTGKTTSEMKTITIFSDASWDIEKIEDWSNNIWFMGTSPTYSDEETYPLLWWEEFEWQEDPPFGGGDNQASIDADLIDLVECVLTEDLVNFGNVSLGESYDTLGNLFGKFLLKNNGTVKVDVDIKSGKNATEFLLGTSPLFQFQSSCVAVGCGTGNVGSWLDFDKSNQTIMNSLEINMSKDTLRTDLKIAVPVDEPAGTKSDVLTFTCSQIA
jgi:hypothetical protein